ncbi:MAG: WD40/YVTN/BNR-like repeat-containing protein, partial [Longimicrobiales bacterium]
MNAPKAFPGLLSAAAATLTLAFLLLATPTDVLGQRGATGGLVNATVFQGMTFRMVGPTRGGRSTTVAGHPDHPHTFYAGFTGGGVWKTSDAGINWRPISDGYFETGSIGAIRVAPSDSRIVYVGTGSDGIRSNVIDGRGVYRSTDAGETWEHVGLREVGQIGAVEVHPTNPDVVYVAAMGKAFKPTPDRGVYKSTNGGRTWDKVLFTSDSVGAVDLELNPGNP